MDVGPETVKEFSALIAGAGTVVWNGPMGVFEMEPFSKGTFALAKAVAESNVDSIVGGGDSVSALQQSGLADKITHISTGGGASLEMLEGKLLPGLAALQDK
jgi:phosphoglycerate kinase